MKKLFLIAALAVFGLSNVNAQEFALGAKGGINFASLSGDGAENADGITSFHVGLVAEVLLSDQFAFQPEILYSVQGASYGEDITMQLDYVNIPLMFKYYVAEGLNIHAGPQVGFNVKSEMEYDGDNIDLAYDMDDVETLDLGAGIGIEFKLPMGAFFQGRYNYGFSEVIKDSEMKNSVIQLSVGFMF